MTDQLTLTGLEIDSLETRIATVSAALRTAIAANLDLSVDQPTGQLVRILLEHIQQFAELLQEIHSQFDPDQATGASQTALALVTGTQRRAATFGTVAVTLNLDALAVAPAGTLFAVLGDPANTWALDTAVTAVGAGDYAGVATSTVAGAVQALAGTITVIPVAVAGLNTVTNAADATMGLEEETDAELRERRELEVTQGGSTSTDAIRAALLQVEGVIEAYVYENDTDVTVATMPPHSITAVIWDGAAPAATDLDIATAIYENKAAGIRSFGNHAAPITTVTDSQGTTHAIDFYRATQIAVGLEFTTTTDADYPGDATFKAAMAALAQAQQGVGDDVMISRWIANAFTVPGVVEVTNMRTELMSGGGFAVTNRVISALEIATIAVADIDVI